MILTGPEIRRQMDLGRIRIDPVPTVIGPNSVDMTLADTLLVYTDVLDRVGGVIIGYLDTQRDNATHKIRIRKEGFVLRPGILYLGSTVELTDTPHHLPYVDGRSSTGRLGISVHVTAGRGDVGFVGRWTLEITVVHAVRVYAGMRIAQITFHEVRGDIQPYAGRYQNATGVESSKMHEPDRVSKMNDPDKVCEKCGGTGWAGARSGVSYGGLGEMVGEPCPNGCPTSEEP